MQAARIIEAFSRGIGIMRALDPQCVDEAFLNSAISFIARALAPVGSERNQEVETG
jgi:hypothetical protein